MPKFRNQMALLAVSAALGNLVGPAGAVEGGSGAYLLGSRDIMAGYVPASGTFIANDLVYVDGTAPFLSIGGAVVTQPQITAWIDKISATHIFGEFDGTNVGVNFTLPVAKAHMEADTTAFGSTYLFDDDQSGLGDVIVTPIFGWHAGNVHTSLSLSMFFPTGEYSLAVVKPLQDVFDVLSISKNRFAFDPTFSGTYLDPETGFELSGALGVTFSQINEATDYQTAPELHFEGTIAQHLPNGWVLGFTGYAYQQLDDDSGSGAENFKTAIGAQSLQARIFGLGPVIQYGTKLGDVPVTFEAKYIQEFESRRRLEGESFWFTAGIAF